MRLVKKWCACVVCCVLGVLILALGSFKVLNLPSPLSILFGAKSISFYDVIFKSELMEKAIKYTIDPHFTWLKVFAMATMIVAILLVVYSIVLALKNINVIKSKSRAFGIVTFILLGFMVVAVIGLLISSNIYAIALETVCKKVTILKVDVTLGIYQPVVTTISASILLLTIVFSVIKTKKVKH